ncbi:hypothetical protein [Streptomyces chattanoogensis]|uniref:Uncharacterized protein n=1 Tax=Streptomyces chattanoogensis TaxID=66876 RepID=A0A0N0H0S1_9ACTN|nr:hypothetical protein [Streptomyces chattanoogensis]KPC63862.1 hypothetical protein ADL29_14355 [Streptomyces chattanoogensis]
MERLPARPQGSTRGGAAVCEVGRVVPLRDRLADRRFVDDSGPWLDAARAWGDAARTALRLVEAVKAGDEATPRQQRERIPELVKAAKSFVYVDMKGKKVPVVVADGVLDTFV